MDIFYYSSMDEFSKKSKHDEAVGDIVKTFGFYNSDDGGAATYIVTSNSKPLSDNLIVSREFIYHKFHELKIISDNGIGYVEQFGAQGIADESELSDEEKTRISQLNKSAIESAFNSGIPNIEFSAKKYLVTGGITVENSVNINGNSAVIEMCGNNDSVIKLSKLGAFVEDVALSNVTLRGKDVESACALLWGDNVCNFSVDNVRFDTCNRALYISSGSESSNTIAVKNCIVTNALSGFEFDDVIDFKIKNSRIELVENENSKGLIFNQNTIFGLVEDVSVCYAGDCAVLYEGQSETWDGLAIERILFKNLLIDESNYGIKATYNEIPLHFSNAMLVNVNYGIYLEYAKNLVVTNSSVLIKSPSTAADDAVPICVRTYAQAKFSHTQFDFPHNFNDMSTYDEGEPCELSFVDCTIQKTDIADVDGVVEPTGFGYITDTHSLAAKLIESFDACEFRSYIKNYATTVAGNEEEITNYNFPMMLSALNETDSKLIIKNCRFVNENTCTVPYFKLDGGKFDNIVVYNCFFENYNYTDPNNSSDFPIFGKLTNNGLSCDVYGYNIFAKCNMRSSEPIRNTGTTINEMKAYE